MPANLPPNYYEKERELRFASTPEEKIQIYLELLAIMPKHKGTDKLKADLRAKIAKLKREIAKKPGAARFDFYHVPKEGAAQVVLLGLPNSGKSQILSTLTNAQPEIQNYPFTTVKPQVGMLIYENTQIQIVDMPPVSRDYAPGWIFGIARGSDLLLITLNLEKKGGADQIEYLLSLLGSKSIKILSKTNDLIDENLMYKRAIFVCNKNDSDGATERFAKLFSTYNERFVLVSISALRKKGIENLKRRIFTSLEIIRVYTKPPKRDVDRSNPFVLKKGARVIDLASEIHKDFLTDLKFVRLWRKGKFNGMRVDKGEILQDEDVIEFHTR